MNYINRLSRTTTFFLFLPCAIQAQGTLGGLSTGYRTSRHLSSRRVEYSGDSALAGWR